MINAHKFAGYLNRTKLSADEFWFLYRMSILEGDNKDGKSFVSLGDSAEAFNQFSRWSKEYEETATIGNYKPDWIAVALKLEDRGYLDIFTRRDDTIKISDLKVTDKFKQDFLVKDLDKAFNEVIKLYPKMVQIKGTTNEYPAFNRTISELIKIYDEVILQGGNLMRHERFLMITEMYLKKIGTINAPMNIENYMHGFEGIAMAYEETGFKVAKSDGEDL